MRRHTALRNIGRAVALAAAVTTSGTAWAQGPARLVDRESAWINWLVLVGVILVVCMSGFLKSKRSHLH